MRQATSRSARFSKRHTVEALALSDCPSKENGGDLGQIGKGQTVSEFENVLFRMQEGELSCTPVDSRYGYHIIHLRRLQTVLPVARLYTNFCR